MSPSINTRRYDLDWLRVGAFALLIFYHIGMYYVTWGWHVKSQYAGDFLEPVMLLINPWRLSLLFFISGVAVRFAVDKTFWVRFAGQRFLRLFIPLVFGMAVIVPPQTYFELLSQGSIEPGYGTFYAAYFNFADYFGIFVPTYNHLWYVLYVLIYTMIVAPLAPLLRVVLDGRMGELLGRILKGPWLFLIPALPFIVYRFTIDIAFPETHDIRGDWGAHIRYFTIFFFGYIIAKNAELWKRVSEVRRMGVVFVGLAAIVLSLLWANWEWVIQFPTLTAVARSLRVLYMWGVIITLLALGQHTLNRPSRALTYLTEAVFPYYILHQTLIILIGYPLTQISLPVLIEIAAVVTFTIGGCVFLHEYVIRRIMVLRPLFGLKFRPPSPQSDLALATS